MTFAEILKLATTEGLGVLSFAALLFGFYKAAGFATNFVENHMDHLQTGMDSINDKLDKLIDLLSRRDGT